MDRFLFKIVVRYPTPRQERQILDRMSKSNAVITIDPVMRPEEIGSARAICDEIAMDERLKDYIVNLVTATRDPTQFRVPIAGLIQYGASPRATLALAKAARARAFLDGRGFVLPQDVKDIAPLVLRHRLILSYEAEAEEKTGDDLVRTLLEHVPVP